MANVEIWQGSSSTEPYRWIVRDAEPPRGWYGARDDGAGGWAFEPLPDTMLAQLDDLAEPAMTPQAVAVVAAFQQQMPPQPS